MKKLPVEKILGIWLPVTAAAIILFALLALFAFNKDVTAAGFIFATLSGCAIIAMIVEFLLVYETLVEMWFKRDRSIVAAVWFVVSLCLAIQFTPDKSADWQTVVRIAAIFAVLFSVPYLLAKKFGGRITESLSARLSLQHKPCDEHEQIKAVLAQTSNPKHMGTDEEIKKYDDLIAGLSPELVKSLPQLLQRHDALLLLVLLQEEGFLNNDFLPTIIDGRTGKPNQSLYAYIANAVSLSLVINEKWQVFEPFWSLKNGAQLLSAYKTKAGNTPSEHQVHIGKIFRKATRICPRLETRDLNAITKV